MARHFFPEMMPEDDMVRRRGQTTQYTAMRPSECGNATTRDTMQDVRVRGGCSHEVLRREMPLPATRAEAEVDPVYLLLRDGTDEEEAARVLAERCAMVRRLAGRE